MLKSPYIISDIIIVYLNDDTIYNPRSSGHLSTRKLNELLMQKLFPYFYEILSDNDPIPLFFFGNNVSQDYKVPFLKHIWKNLLIYLCLY